MKNFEKLLTAAVLGALSIAHPAAAAPTDISNAPLVSEAGVNVRPNIMFILDDSGSMARNYIGDNANSTNQCRSGGRCSSGGDLGSPSSFSPPFMAKEFNGLAYNPALRYDPPIDYDGTNTTYKSYDNSSGWSWTAVKLNPFNSTSTYNLRDNFPERWYCDGNENSASDRVRCRRNLDPLIQPSMTATVYSRSVSSGVVTVTLSLSQSGASGHGCAEGDLITVSGLSVSAGNGEFKVHDVVNNTRIQYRYSSTSMPSVGETVTVSACHQVFPVSSLTRAGSSGSNRSIAVLTLDNHGCRPGDVITVAGANDPLYNGRFTVLSSSLTANSFRYQMTANAGGNAGNASNTRITVSSCPLPLAQLTRTGSMATATYLTAHGCKVGDTITVTGAAQSAYNNTFTVTGVPAPNQVTFTVGGSPATPATRATSSVPIRVTTCPGTTTNYSTSTNVHPQMQGFPLGAFDEERVVGQPVYYTIRPLEYCTSQDLVNCESLVPTATHPFPATVRYCRNETAQKSEPGSASATSNRATSVDSTSSSNSGCQRVYAGNYTYARYGYFERVEINPSITHYPKVASRTDCSGAVGPTGCTYQEEMTNFANWFAYYRARMLMMKTASGIAFHRLNATNANDTDARYRVGFHTINNSRTLTIAPFGGDSSTSQKKKWYDQLYGTTPSGNTPLRAALARVGRYFAGQYRTSSPFNHDPMEYSCQQNLAFLTSDGYWNSSAGVKLNGSSSIGDEDGANCTSSKPSVPRPFCDNSQTSGTLADVAYYYYVNDLRTPTFNANGALGSQVHENNVPSTFKDPATHQHMTTFTMGLGLDSLLVYAPNYDTAGTSPDYNAIVGGTKHWPSPSADKITTVDDLWHAAVNGRGTYFSAKDPLNVVEGLTEAFNSLQQITGTAAAAATSNPNIVSGDNFLFASNFTTVDWYGDVTRQTINIDDGTVNPGIDWSAQAELDKPTMTGPSSDGRTIFMFDAGATNKLKPFLWANLTAAEKGFFSGDKVPHFNTLEPAQQDELTCAGCGEKILNYIRGHRQHEASTNSLLVPDTNPGKLFRQRTHVLGDIVTAEAVYVKSALFEYADPGHLEFRTTGAPATRPAMLYVGANDGMLHAFDANTGVERWAYIPTHVLSKLVRLTDKDYANAHTYFVDGTPAVGDVCVANCSDATKAVWKTILVGGLNAGGRGYYALDITDPTPGNVKAMWEVQHSNTCIPMQSGTNRPVDPVNTATGAPYFSDCDIGLSFGNPVITKRADGKWVVLVTSGYNNISPGTGGGFLYVLDAATGEILNKIPTLIDEGSPNINAGDTTTPSGLARISAFAADTNTNNTALRVYGGDLNGNLWRFDNNNQLAVSGNTAKLLTFFGGPNAAGSQGDGSQPIQAKPELGEVKAGGLTYEMVYVGTGRYLGNSDLSTTTQQSFYAVKDDLSAAPGWGGFRSLIGTEVVRQTLTQSVNPQTFVTERKTTNNPVDLSTKAGWVIDFNPGGVSPGERNTTDPTLDLGTLSFTTNVLIEEDCAVGGSSFLYFVNYATGGPVSSANGVSGQLLGQALATRPVVVRLPNGKLISLTRLSQGSTVSQPIPVGSVGSSGKRINWREVLN